MRRAGELTSDKQCLAGQYQSETNIKRGHTSFASQGCLVKLL
jgi:hypothetical protein